MMKILKRVFIGILVFFFGIIALLFLSFANVPDRVAVDFLIPTYHNAINYKTNASNGFPDGLPGGDISFETDDNAMKIIDFYKNKLVDNGWKVVEDKIEKDPFPSTGVTAYSLRLKRSIGPYVFNANVTKSEFTLEAKGKYKDPELGKRVIIFVDHR